MVPDYATKGGRGRGKLLQGEEDSAAFALCIILVCIACWLWIKIVHLPFSECRNHLKLDMQYLTTYVVTMVLVSFITEYIRENIFFFTFQKFQ